MRQRSAGLEPAAIQAMSSSRVPTVGPGALSSTGGHQAEPFSRAKGIPPESPADMALVNGKGRAPHKQLPPVAERGVHKRESGHGRGIGAQDAGAQ